MLATQTQLAQVSVTVRVQVSVIRSACQLANRFQPAQVNLQASQRVIAVAAQLARVKVQVQAHQSVIQDQIAPASVTVKVQVSVIRSVHRLANQFRLA